MRRTRQRPTPNPVLPVLALAVTTSVLRSSIVVDAFVVLPDVRPICTTIPVARRTSATLYSSVGGGGKDPPASGGDGRRSGGEWDDFLNPDRDHESENLFKAREFMSENSLPISHGLNGEAENSIASENSSAIIGPNDFLVGGLSKDSLARNPYMKVVSQLSPSELISKFTATAHPRVQNAVRTTILGLIGGLPKMAFETTTVTTGQKLASLMFQLQMTGYMFKNAEYRLSVQQSLGVESDHFDGDRLLLTASATGDEKQIDPLAGKVKGKLRIRYPGSSRFDDSPAGNGSSCEAPTSGSGVEMEVDAAAYMAELRNEVEKLRMELTASEKEEEKALRKDLLLYIRTLPQRELQSLTNTMSQDVLVAMKGLVNAVLSGIGDGQIGPDTVTEQSGEAMAQLCMWQLVIGYNLRTLEVREEMRSSLKAADDLSGGGSGVDLSPGALE